MGQESAEPRRNPENCLVELGLGDDEEGLHQSFVCVCALAQQSRDTRIKSCRTLVLFYALRYVLEQIRPVSLSNSVPVVLVCLKPCWQVR